MPAAARHGRLVDAAAAAFAVAGLAGVVANAVWLTRPGPGPFVQPHFLGLWLATLTLFYGAQIAWQQHGPAPPPTRRRQVALASQYAVLVLVALLLVVGCGVGYRLDGVGWSLALLACLAVNMALAWPAHREPAAGALLKADSAQAPLLPDAAAVAVNDGEGEPAAALGGAGLPRWARALRTANACLLGAAFVCLALLLGGCWTQAAGYRAYPPRGAFYAVPADGGCTVEVLAYCTGPRNASLPTFFFDVGGGGHSSSDLYGLQFALNDLGRRVCTYDYPGCGWSGYAVSAAQPPLVGAIAAALGEPGPFILVGTMDGGPERIYRYALAHPEDVAALVPIDYGPPEFPTYQQARNLSDAAARAYAEQQLRGRLAFGEFIAAVGVQWGLIGLFAPPRPTYVPAELAGEQAFLNAHNEKQWATQVYHLAAQVADLSLAFAPSPYTSDRSLDPAIPVFNLFNRRNHTAACEAWGYPPSSADCAALGVELALAYEFAVATTTITPGSELVVCDDCSGFLSGDGNLAWAVDNIMRLVGHITVPPSA